MTETETALQESKKRLREATLLAHPLENAELILKIDASNHAIGGECLVCPRCHSQQPVPRGFPLFKRCEWLVVNRIVVKRIPPQ